MTAAVIKSDSEFTKDTPNLALMDELWGVFVSLGEKIDCTIMAPYVM